MDEATNTSERGLHHLIIVGEFLLDRETIRVWRGSKPLQLSMKQFRLLEVFMQHPGEPLPRRTLKERVWGVSSTIEESTVDAEIARLRRAIGGRRREAPIRTVRKLGYVFQKSKRLA
jgi:two-component system, OmpR family, phosphate regulon response regulator PhoB